jgi:hypothetical protein
VRQRTERWTKTVETCTGIAVPQFKVAQPRHVMIANQRLFMT